MNEATIHLLYFLKSSSLKVFDVKKKLKIPFIEKPISTRNLIIQILVEEIQMFRSGKMSWINKENFS